MRVCMGAIFLPARRSCQQLRRLREDALIALGVGAALVTAVAPTLVAAAQRHVSVILPQVLLAGHALYCRALLVPHAGDVEQDVGLPVALLGLVRLEQEHAWRADHRFAGLVAVRLGDD